MRRRRTKEAISLAMQGRWDEAVSANKSIIEVFPNDINAYNRLGKSLTELGHYDDAKGAYKRALEIDPKNSIASRNLRRLSLLKEGKRLPSEGNQKVNPQLFIEETGKAGVAILENAAPREVLAKMAPGDPVQLKVDGQKLTAVNEDDEYLGQVEAKIGMRLSKLMQGGNCYTAAVASSADSEVKMIITEVFQHPSQAGRPSFPAKVYDGFRSYVKGSILKYELGEDEGAVDESGYPVEAEGDAEALPEGMTLLHEDGSVAEAEDKP